MIQIYTQIVNGVWFAVACTEQIVATSFAETRQKVLSDILNKLPINASFQMVYSLSAFAKNVFALMADVFEGKDITYNFDFAMDNLPTYTCIVLKAVMQIPLGYVSTYGAIAQAVGGGPRAVGNIMANNLFAPLIPCHRVVKANFSLGGYGGVGVGVGLKTKYVLLMKEKRGCIEFKSVSLGAGSILQVYPVELTLNKTFDFFNLF